MAPTEGRFTRPEQQWGCHRGTPRIVNKNSNICNYVNKLIILSKLKCKEFIVAISSLRSDRKKCDAKDKTIW